MTRTTAAVWAALAASTIAMVVALTAAGCGQGDTTASADMSAQTVDLSSPAVDDLATPGKMKHDGGGSKKDGGGSNKDGGGSNKDGAGPQNDM